MNAINDVLELAAWGMAEHLWQTTLFLVPLLLLAVALRPAPARIRAAAWSLALLKLVLPLGLLGALLFRSAAPPDPAPAAPTLAAFETVVEVFALEPREAAAPGAFPWGVALTAAWLAGLLGIALRQGRSNRVPDARLSAEARERLERLAREAGLDPRRVRAVPDGVPRVRGAFVPRVEVPVGIIATLDDAALRATLLHEAAHVERRDPLRDGVLQALLAAFWFYPPAWLIVRGLRGTAEIACDERALARGATAEDLADALASAIRQAARGTPRAMSACMAASSPRSLLQDRFQRLDQPPRLTMNRHRIALAIAGLVVLCSALVPSRILASGDAVLESLRAPGLPFTPEAAGLAEGQELLVGAEVDVRAEGPQARDVSLPQGLTSAHAQGLEATVREIVKAARFAGTGRAFIEIAWPVGERGTFGAGNAVLERAASGVRAVIRPPLVMTEALTPPTLVKRVAPDYPASAMKAGVAGEVIVSAVIDADGTIASAHVIKGLADHPEFDAAALEAVRQWIYEPSRLQDQPVPVSLVVRLNFKIGE